MRKIRVDGVRVAQTKIVVASATETAAFDLGTPEENARSLADS